MQISVATDQSLNLFTHIFIRHPHPLTGMLQMYTRGKWALWVHPGTPVYFFYFVLFVYSFICNGFERKIQVNFMEGCMMTLLSMGCFSCNNFYVIVLMFMNC
jgi:hypothetical protein